MGSAASAKLADSGAGSPTGSAAIARQEVSERIESGQSSQPRASTSLTLVNVLLAARMGGDGRRKRSTPWLESTRLTASGSSFRIVRSRVRAQAPAVAKRQGRAEAKASSRCGGRCGGWGPNPIGSLLPVQRELGASSRQGRSEIERDVVVLASCSGCRGRRETPGSKLSLRGGRVV